MRILSLDPGGYTGCRLIHSFGFVVMIFLFRSLRSPGDFG
ncbi:hypothetical protein B4100_1408 [Heyndrickxia coagulans]|uniref:Uncharacterized protein n=1 Tax=Heyndrickxia coagulans TaxID=1398 RepID=A0A150KI24_HEYCO|nr:hypothetical protein B4100_1408 [Heyndrickxia coagulans]KYC72998.1 hypothetical protein B4099_1454 [Heyndrickxia coagulans]